MSVYECHPAYGGEMADIIAEDLGQVGGACTVTTTRVQTGTYGIKFPLDVNAQKALLQASVQSPTGLQSRISYWPGFFGVSAQPNSGQIGLLYLGTGADGATKWFRIGDTGASDTKLRVYDAGGTLRATSTASISTSGLTEVCICIDCLSASTVLITIWIGASVDTFLDTGITPASFWSTTAFLPYWGENMSAGNRGAALYGDDFTCRTTTDPTLAPHLTAFMRPNVYGGKQFSATKEGNSAAWTGFADTTPNTWKDIAATRDLLGTTNPGHDGDTSGLDVSATNSKHLFRWGDGSGTFVNPVSGKTIDSVYQAFVGRLTGAGKTSCVGLWRLNANEVTYALSASFSTTFVGMAAASTYDNSRPGGGSWADTDFGDRVSDKYSELEFGLQSSPSGTVSFRATEIPGPTIVAYTATLPLAPFPPLRVPLFNTHHASQVKPEPELAPRVLPSWIVGMPRETPKLAVPLYYDHHPSVLKPEPELKPWISPPWIVGLPVETPKMRVSLMGHQPKVKPEPELMPRVVPAWLTLSQPVPTFPIPVYLMQPHPKVKPEPDFASRRSLMPPGLFAPAAVSTKRRFGQII